MQNVSGYGLRVRLVASATFPAGITLTQFADDADPFDTPAVQVADKAMGLNGDLIVWATANPLTAVLNMIPGTADDRNLEILLEANRVGRGKFPANDVITLTAIYPDGSTRMMTPGAITDGIPGKPVGSSGRLKTKPYTFAFENQAAS